MKQLLPLWENPEIQGINRLPMSSPLQPFESAEEALADAIAGPEFRSPDKNPLYLELDTPGIWDGTVSSTPWKFKILSSPYDDLPDSGDCLSIGGRREAAGLSGWTNPEFDDSSWVSINVPGTWSRQGGDSRYENCFDKPHYTNVQMPFLNLPPNAPDDNPTGLYRRKFSLPAFWKNRRVILHIGSAESVSYVYINGFFAGAGKDTRLPCEYDITPFINEGENLLCIKVIRYSDASFVEDQDQWWLGGIHRTVFLYSTDVTYIKDIKALPGIISDNKGIIKLTCFLDGKLDNKIPYIIKYNLYPFNLPSDAEDAKKKAADLIKKGGVISANMEFFADYRVNSNMIESELVLDNPKMWSHEEPNLYIITAELFHEKKLLQCAAFCTGFRNLKIARREFLINDKKVYIKGANRHEHDEKTGKTLSVKAMLNDIRILKTHNFNAVRTSHYPDDERWYELCDRYGIYLWDEANIESHCFYNQLYGDTEWTHAFESRIQRMVQRDKNHPSVVVWSLGNESGWGFNHDMGAAWIRKYDPSRPLHYEGAMGSGWDKGKNVTDIVCPMYPAVEGIINFARECDDERPLIMCEYSHAMGNSNGSLADYWKAIESHHGLQGGFIWEWRDHGFEAYTEDGTKFWKYGGDFGDKPSDYDFICDGLLFPDQSLKPAMAECLQVHAPVRFYPVAGKPFNFIIENRYDFSSLDHLLLRYKLFEAKAGTLDVNIIREGIRELPFLKPDEKSEISFFDSEEIFLPLFKGYVVFHTEFFLKEDTPLLSKGHVVTRAQRLLKEEHEPFVFANKINTSNTLNETDIQKLAEKFKPSLYRVATQNDCLKTNVLIKGEKEGNNMYVWTALDLLHLKLAEEKKEKVLLDGRSAIRYSYVLLAGDRVSDRYKQYAENPGLGFYSLTITEALPGLPAIMEIVFDLDQNLPELPKVGIMAEIPSYYNEISWFGLGPGESYSDRNAGVFLGRYKLGIADFEVPYVVPQENGNRSGVRDFTLLSSDSAKGNITIRADKPVNFSVSRYSQENMWNACHTYELIDLSKGPNGKYFLSIDICQRGVGTATCGPDTREEYRIRSGLFSMKLFLYKI